MNYCVVYISIYNLWVKEPPKYNLLLKQYIKELIDLSMKTSKYILYKFVDWFEHTLFSR